jgi:PAS domain S-box-containing protein
MLPDEEKTKEQFISELVALRQQVSELEASETERKQTEEALRESEYKYRYLFEELNDAAFLADVETGRILDTNKQGEALLGRTREEIIGMHQSELHPPEMAKEYRRMFAIHVEKGHAADYDGEAIRKDGSIVQVNISAAPVTIGGKQLILGLFREITERKQAEEALRESEGRYSALLNLGGRVGEAIVMLQDTEQGNAIHTFVSNEWPRITGYSRKELLGMSFFDLLAPKYHEASLKRHRRKMSGEIIPGLFEMSIIIKDGTEVPIEVTSAYTTYKGQRANVAFIRDITERKQAEEREKELQQQLYFSSRLASIGELAAGVAHEISNPLTGIMGFSERLMRRSTDDEVSQDLEVIHSEAQRVAKVVENLLTFARRRQPKKEYLNINDILQQALELRAYALETSNIEVVTSLASGLPKTMADFHQIQEVFLNIILNAEQAMSEANAGGKLSVKTQPTGDYIRISFADDGPGIPAEQLDKVFDPFFTTRGEKGGTGLGLSLCHGIVTEHGGKIYAKSKPGKGATFFVELPLSPIGASFADTY